MALGGSDVLQAIPRDCDQGARRRGAGEATRDRDRGDLSALQRYGQRHVGHPDRQVWQIHFLQPVPRV
mgnify:CR=1 FL=1